MDTLVALLAVVAVNTACELPSPKVVLTTVCTVEP